MNRYTLSSGQSSSGLSLKNGDSLVVYSGGTAVGITVESGGELDIGSGGSAVDAAVSDGGEDDVFAGGSATGTVLDGGTEWVWTNGTAIGTTVNNGVTNVNGGGEQKDYGIASGTVLNTTVPGAGSEESVRDGGTAFDVVVGSESFEWISSGGSAVSTTVDSYGDEVVYAGGTASSTMVQSNSLEIVSSGGAAVGTTVNSGAAQTVFSGAIASGTTVHSGGGIDVVDLPYASGGTASADTTGLLTVSVGGQIYVQQLSLSDANRSFQLTAGLSGVAPGVFGGTLLIAEAAPCFRAGTLIATDRGEIPVEALRVGDPVLLVCGGTAPVRWVGHRRVECRRHPRPQDVWPVRVATGAFGTGQPRRDLFLSPDHAVFVDGALIPIRYLRNGATIRQEPMAAIVYYHIELDSHSILLAEGLPAETYLDTGNRGAFANGGGAVMAHADFARRVWAEAACAPLVLAGPVLAAAKRHLLDRAVAHGHVQTTEAGLRLLADGAPVWPEIDGGLHCFTLPNSAASLRLVSRHAVPAEELAESTDERRLGVAVARLAVDGQAVAPGDPRRAAGWYPPEPGWQWTDGDALLHGPVARRVEVMLLPLLRYWRGRPAVGAARSRAGRQDRA